MADKLSDQERQFFSEYSALISAYSEEVGFEVTKDLAPPKSLLVEIRVVEDTGQILTEDGFVDFKKNQVHFLKRTDAMVFVRRGFFKLVQDE